MSAEAAPKYEHAEFQVELGTLINKAAAAGLPPEVVMLECEVQKLFAFRAVVNRVEQQAKQKKSNIIKVPGLPSIN